MLELGLDAEPDQQTLAVVSARGARPCLHRDREPPLHRPVRVGAAFRCHCRWRQSSNIDSCRASYTCEGGQFTLAGWVEQRASAEIRSTSASSEIPCISPSLMQWATLNAAVLATVFVGALRNARRRGVSLAQQTQLANEALYGFGDDSDFVTGQVVRVDHASGLARFVTRRTPLADPDPGGPRRVRQVGPWSPVRDITRLQLSRSRASAGSRRPARLPDRWNPRAQRSQW